MLEKCKRENCDKNIQKTYLDRAPALRIVENWFGRFHQIYFKLQDQRPFSVNKNSALLLPWLRINQNFPWKWLQRVWKSIYQLSFAIWRTLVHFKTRHWTPHSVTRQNRGSNVSRFWTELPRVMKNRSLWKRSSKTELWMCRNRG